MVMVDMEFSSWVFSSTFHFPAFYPRLRGTRRRWESVRFLNSLLYQSIEELQTFNLDEFLKKEK